MNDINFSETAHQLNQMIKWNYEKKLRKSKKIIAESLLHPKKPIISSSFGKDSMALTFLVHEADNTIPILFNNTGVNFPETLKYKDMMVEKYGLIVIETRPEMTFWEIVKIYGYPKKSRNSKTGDKREPACCKILKYKPTEKTLKGLNIDLNFVGLLGDEGRQRRWAYISKGGAYYYMKSMKLYKCIPLIFWTKEDVWRYHDENNIPRNPVYAKYGIERTGCITCTGHKNWKEEMAKHHPSLMRKIIRDMNGSNLDDYETPVKLEVQ